MPSTMGAPPQGAGNVTSAMILDDSIINADIKTTAAIAYAKLAALTSANLLVANSSNVAVVRAITGDITISNTGVTTIGALKVLTSMLNNDSVDKDKLGIITTKGDVLSYSTEPVRLAVGTNDQVLTADSVQATGVKWAAVSGGKSTTTEVTTWTTTFSTTSTSLVDITDGTVTISSLTTGTTYDLFAVATCNAKQSANGNSTNVALFIDGTEKAHIREHHNASTDQRNMTVSGIKKGVTGSTSYIAKIQCKVESGTSEINSLGQIQSIFIIAVEV